GLTGSLRGLGLRVVRPFWRAWDRRTARRVTAFIANSTHIAAEIERCYRREAQVIHPPVRAEFLPKEPRAQARGREHAAPEPRQRARQRQGAATSRKGKGAKATSSAAPAAGADSPELALGA